MHPTYITALATIALLAPAWTAPAQSEMLQLWNGENTVEAMREVGHPPIPDSPDPIALAKRDLEYSCKGSVGCKYSVTQQLCDEAFGKDRRQQQL